MSWIVLITFSVLFGSVSALLQRVLVRDEKADTYSYSVLTQLTSAVVCFLLALFFGRNTFPEFSVILESHVYVFILLSSSLYAVNAILCFKALQSIEVSKFSVLYATRAVVTIVIASVFLKESLNANQLLGAGMILFSILYLNTKSYKEFLRFGKGEILTLTAALAFGIATVSDKYIIEWFDFIPYLTLDFLLPAITLIAIKPKVVKEFRKLIAPKLLPIILLFSTLYALAALTFFGAMDASDNTSLVSSIGQITTVATVILGIVVLKEREDMKKKLLASFLGFAGLLLIVI